MPPVIISDTSCLILLNKIEQLDLLSKVFTTVVVTQTIVDEWNQQLPDWIKVENPLSDIQPIIFGFNVDKGEASAIALALEKRNCTLIIDEMKGRKLARQLGISITGKLGVLALAKALHFIDAVKPLLNLIQQTDFRLSERLLNEFLQEIGE